MQSKNNITKDLVNKMLEFRRDPYAWVVYSFPWGHGELAQHTGPEPWQKDILIKLGSKLITMDQAVQLAVTSGHGIGKSALVSWLILWAMATKVNTRGIVTANTENQLKTKTWAELSKWHRLSITNTWFDYEATSISSKDPKHKKSWRVDMIPWSKEKTEAFAGLHNKGNRIILIFDEASAIPDEIWEVSEGALTDSNTEIIWAVFGNPTRNTGRFRQCFSKLKHRWDTMQVDSRDVSITNKEQIQKWIDDYGIDSDFVKVRVRGLFPSSSDLQFIPSNVVDAARGRHINESKYMFAPKIIGVDPAWSGDDETCVYFRQGLYARQLGVYRKVMDDMVIAGYVAKWETELQADAVFIDMGYGTGIYSAGKQMNRQWTLISFASESNDIGFLNKRAQIWNDMKQWLTQGGCIPNDPVLCDELIGPEYVVKLDGKIKLESKDDMKKRGIPSPNRADALALTFSHQVMKKGGPQGKQEFVKKEYDLFA